MERGGRERERDGAKREIKRSEQTIASDSSLCRVPSPTLLRPLINKWVSLPMTELVNFDLRPGSARLSYRHWDSACMWMFTFSQYSTGENLGTLPVEYWGTHM